LRGDTCGTGDEEAVAARGHADFGCRFPDERKGRLDTGGVRGTLRREQKRSRTAQEKRTAKRQLQLPDLQTDGARRDMQFIRGLGHAQMPRRRLEGLQSVQRGQRCNHNL